MRAIHTWTITLVLCFCCQITTAQDLSGLWQGVSYVTTQPTYYVITMNLQQNGALATGTALTKNPISGSYAIQTVSGTVSNNSLTFTDLVVINTNNVIANWCLRSGTLVYDPALEKLSGEVLAPNCTAGTITMEMFRLRIIADTNICIQKNVAIRATGKNLRWYKDSTKQTLIFAGDNINPFVTSDTTFYVTQTLYNTESPVVPVTIHYQNFKSQIQSFDLCDGQSVIVGDTTYRTSGVYTKRFVSNSTCDSLVTTTITIKPTIKIQRPLLTLCAGETVTVGDTTYKTTGIYVKKFKTTEGCDSTITTNLIIRDKLGSSKTVTLCEGETVTVGDTTYRTTGQYSKKLTTASGCDSIVMTFLTIKPSQRITRNPIICAGETIIVGDTTYKTSGSYVKKFKTTEGCDSIITTNLTVNPSPKQTQNITICEGETVTVGDTTYKTSGNYVKKYKTVNGCDSLILTNLVVNPVKKNGQDMRICRGTSVTVGDTTYRTEGTYVKKLRTYTGCDSIVTTRLKIVDEVVFSQKLKICAGLSIVVGDTTYKTTGIYVKKLRSTEGCDSIVTTDLTVVKLDIITSSDTSIRLGDSVLLYAAINLPLSVTWKWTPNVYLKCDTCATTLAKPKISTKYQVEVFDKDSKCRKTGSVFIKTKTDCDLFVPTAFSPNDDKVNDLWTIYPSSCVKQIKRVAIFNRWGGQILTKNNITVLSDQGIDIWDGLVSGKPLDTGIFVYVIEAEYVNGETAVLGGDFSIVK
jgi:gliding motility-associated-like protein